MTVLSIVNGALGTITKRIGTGTEELGDKKTRGDHPNYSIVEIGQNTKKSPGDLRKHAVTQTPVENPR